MFAFLFFSISFIATTVAVENRTFSAYAVGMNSFGELGIPGVDFAYPPQMISLPRQAESIAQVIVGAGAMDYSSYLLTTNGNAYVMGRDFLNANDSILWQPFSRKTPTLISSPIISNNFGAIASTDAFVLFLDSQNGLVYGAGKSSYLGLGNSSSSSTGYRSTPTLLITHERIVAVAASASHHSLLLSDQGMVYGQGENCFEVLGSNAGSVVYTPTLIPPEAFDNKKIVSIAAGNCFSLFATEEGQVYAMGKYAWDYEDNNAAIVISSSTPKLISGLKDIRKVVAGTESSFFLNSQGRIFAMGSNQNGQLGLGDYVNRLTPALISGTTESDEQDLDKVKFLDVSCNVIHSVFITEQALYVAGKDDQGLLGWFSSNFPKLTLVAKVKEDDSAYGKLAGVATGQYRTLFISNVELEWMGSTSLSTIAKVLIAQAVTGFVAIVSCTCVLLVKRRKRLRQEAEMRLQRFSMMQFSVDDGEDENGDDDNNDNNNNDYDDEKDQQRSSLL